MITCPQGMVLGSKTIPKNCEILFVHDGVARPGYRPASHTQIIFNLLISLTGFEYVSFQSMSIIIFTHNSIIKKVYFLRFNIFDDI